MILIGIATYLNSSRHTFADEHFPYILHTEFYILIRYVDNSLHLILRPVIFLDIFAGVGNSFIRIEGSACLPVCHRDICGCLFIVLNFTVGVNVELCCNLYLALCFGRVRVCNNLICGIVSKAYHALHGVVFPHEVISSADVNLRSVKGISDCTNCSSAFIIRLHRKAVCNKLYASQHCTVICHNGNVFFLFRLPVAFDVLPCSYFYSCSSRHFTCGYLSGLGNRYVFAAVQNVIGQHIVIVCTLKRCLPFIGYTVRKLYGRADFLRCPKHKAIVIPGSYRLNLCR